VKPVVIRDVTVYGTAHHTDDGIDGDGTASARSCTGSPCP